MKKYKVKIEVYKEMTDAEASNMLGDICIMIEHMYPGIGTCGSTSIVKSGDKFGQSFFQETKDEKDVEILKRGFSELNAGIEKEI